MVPHSVESSDHIQSAAGLDSLGAAPAVSCKCIWIICILDCIFLFLLCLCLLWTFYTVLCPIELTTLSCFEITASRPVRRDRGKAKCKKLNDIVAVHGPMPIKIRDGYRAHVDNNASMFVSKVGEIVRCMYELHYDC